MIRRVILILLLLSILTACAPDPTYTPDDATLAAREAAEYATRTERVTLAWRTFYAFGVAVLIVLFILAIYLSKLRYRRSEADVKKAEAEARRAHMIDLGNGRIFDIEKNIIHGTTPQVAQQFQPALPAQPLPTPPKNNGNPYAEFVRAAATVSPDKWKSKTIPRYDRFSPAMRAEDWQEITDVLEREELIDPKVQGKATTVIEGNDLGWLYNNLLTYPIVD